MRVRLGMIDNGPGNLDETFLIILNTLEHKVPTKTWVITTISIFIFLIFICTLFKNQCKKKSMEQICNELEKNIFLWKFEASLIV